MQIRCFTSLLGAALLLCMQTQAQQQYELNEGWQMQKKEAVTVTGETLSLPGTALQHWVPATVPGTVLTSLVNNKLAPDPFYGMNNKLIPDIYNTGNDYYTYWFVKEFTEQRPAGEQQVWLHFRGVNYSCKVYLNGKLVNTTPHEGMYLRHRYNITALLAKDGHNRLAVIVYPAPEAGNPNGGQGGDGMIAKNVAHQYTAGWDWIQPIRDRNTGIWDKVTIEKTGSVNIRNPHVVTRVPGIRQPGGAQQPAVISMGAELENTAAHSVRGLLQYQLDGVMVKKEISLPAHTTVTVQLPDHILENPKLWWPNGYGEQALYHTGLVFTESNGHRDDAEALEIGVREINTSWNETTRSRELTVNGQKIFIKGGNWIISDAMLRFSRERYDAEIRFHRDMNLNLIRIWGGALTERPEFYEACDKYGLLVFQDFWISGDCNGKWLDPAKKEDQLTRRKYPDDHGLFLASVSDQVKMIRNYPSLAFWCGGNEVTPPADILHAMKDSLIPALDGTRYFFDYSNSDSMSYNSLGGNGDGPYGIQPLSVFWDQQTFPFNSEIGSVGTGDLASLQRFLPVQNQVVPNYPGKVDSVWEYHKYIGYDHFIAPYGQPADVNDFANKAQLVNYNQYRGLMEGFSAHEWQWYTGVIIWKTQNPWTALRGQMYDYYLDPNACLYGLHHGSEPLHIMYNNSDGMVMVVNNTFTTQRDLMLTAKALDMEGRSTLLTQVVVEAGPANVKKYLSLKEPIEKLAKDKGLFLELALTNDSGHTVSENLYWLPDASGNYSGLQQLKPAAVTATAAAAGNNQAIVTITNPANAPVAFFNRISLLDAATKKRVLPAFYDDNYVSVLPGESKKITVNWNAHMPYKNLLVSVSGWNVPEQQLNIQP